VIAREDLPSKSVDRFADTKYGCRVVVARIERFVLLLESLIDFESSKYHKIAVGSRLGDTSD